MSPELYEYMIQFVTARKLQRFEDVLARRTRALSVVLEDLYQGHNASACLRSADCFGIQDIHIVESRNTFKVKRDIARGAGQWTTIVKHASTEECYAALRSNGYQILATSPYARENDLHELCIDQKSAIVFGCEFEGLSETAIDQADRRFRIPMDGFTESFNISVAAAITLHTLRHSLDASDLEWGLSDAEKTALRHRWVEIALGPKFAPLARRFAADTATT